jgi:predicted membrane channel-forming protein YqfA (hemolysin III family)
MLAYDYPLLSVVFTIIAVAVMIIIVFFIIWCLVDSFRRTDHRGWAKAGWLILILIIPIIGSIIYVIARPDDATYESSSFETA